MGDYRLVLQDPYEKVFTLPLQGTVKGGGFDCREGTVDAYEGHKEGVWNRVKKLK